ncbi:uncharacterized protein [Eucyclogobius newberryi]|uniref:uncharacterized protein n=1 Tax=Eucyclogobius newberryi TaxID=166745 RepID=UPI003B5BE2FF
MTGRSSFMSGRTSAESWSTGPEGIICSPPVHSSRVLHTPVPPRHASLPLFSPANQSSHSLISPKPNGPTKAPSLPQTSPVTEPEPKGDEADSKLKCPYEETQFELCHKTASGHNISVPVSAKSSCPPSPLMPSADASLNRTPSRPVSRLGALWPALPPIAIIQDRCSTAASYSSELSCSQSQVFDELDAIAPLSASCSSMDQLSESSHCPSKNGDVLSPGLTLLTVGCDSGNLGSLSRVQLLLLNRQETYAASPFSLDEDLISMDNYPDLEMINGVWRPLTAGSISEKCGSTGKAHQNKLDDMEQCSGSSCSWIIDPSPSYNIFKSSDSQCNSSLGSLRHEVAPFEQPSNYSGFAEEEEERCLTIERSEEDRDRKREQRKTKALKMLSKLQDDAPHQSISKGHANFEDFDFLAKYCIFNQERLAEYKRAFEEEDGDGDGYISCLQVLCALKSIIPPELLSEEEEIYVYRILETVDFRVTDGLVDLRLFAVIASLAQKIATMDDFMRSLISNIDFRSLEVKLFKAKKLFLFLLEEQTGDGTSQQMYISPEQVILELKAGGICLEQEAVMRMEIQHIPPLDLLDFLAYLPLFMLIHKSVIANPLEDFCNL